MRVTSHGGKKRVIIDPGEYYTSGDDIIISTLLGSCVSACLWDPVNRIVGMNHFLLANKRYSRDMPVIASEAGRYGIHAMELLINAMQRKGANRHLLRAKAFGGSNVLMGVNQGDSHFAIGDVNCRFITEFLRNENIPLDSSNLGGSFGRIIHFTANDFSVYMKRIGKSAEQSLVQEERRYYQHEISEQARKDKENSIQFW